MAPVSLAALFVLYERTAHGKSAAQLSARDVVELLRFYLSRRGDTVKEVLDDLVRHHASRREASIHHAKRRRHRRISATKQNLGSPETFQGTVVCNLFDASLEDIEKSRRNLVTVSKSGDG